MDDSGLNYRDEWKSIGREQPRESACQSAPLVQKLNSTRLPGKGNIRSRTGLVLPKNVDRHLIGGEASLVEAVAHHHNGPPGHADIGLEFQLHLGIELLQSPENSGISSMVTREFPIRTILLVVGYSGPCGEDHA